MSLPKNASDYFNSPSFPKWGFGNAPFRAQFHCVAGAGSGALLLDQPLTRSTASPRCLRSQTLSLGTRGGTDLQQYRKQGEDLTKQLDHPFEHEEKLTVATKRQQEIITALDITKNQASAKLDEGSEQSTEDTEDKPTQSLRAKKKTTPAMKV